MTDQDPPKHAEENRPWWNPPAKVRLWGYGLGCALLIAAGTLGLIPNENIQAFRGILDAAFWVGGAGLALAGVNTPSDGGR